MGVQVWTMGIGEGVSSVVSYFSGCLVINLDALMIYDLLVLYVKDSVQSLLFFFSSKVIVCALFTLAN